MSAAEKALLPQGLCSRGCGQQGVVGMKHSTRSKEEGKVWRANTSADINSGVFTGFETRVFTLERPRILEQVLIYSQ